MAHTDCETSLVDVVLAHLAEMKVLQKTCANEGETVRDSIARCIEMQQELLREMLTTPLTRRLWLPRQESLDRHVRHISVRQQLGLPV